MILLETARHHMTLLVTVLLTMNQTPCSCLPADLSPLSFHVISLMLIIIHLYFFSSRARTTSQLHTGHELSKFQESVVPTILAYTWWNRQATNDACKSRSLLSCSSHRFSASGQFAAAELILVTTTKPRQRRLEQTHLLLLQMAGDVHPNSDHTSKYHCPVCTRNATSREVSYQCNRCF